MSALFRGCDRRRIAARLIGPTLLLSSLSLLGCGIPLAAAELTATAELGGASGSQTEVSSRAAGANPLDPQATTGLPTTPTSLSTIAPLGTTAPAATASVTAVASPAAGTATATRTPGVTPSPAASGTPGTVTPTPSPVSTRAPAGVTTSVVELAPALSASQSTDPAAAALKLLNDYRASSGRSQLVFNANLAASATSYAQLMARTNYFGHTGPDGSIAETRMTAAGYRGRFKGEALAAGQASADAAIRNWLTSAGHATIVLDPNAVEVGIGYAYGAGSSYGHYWVLVTGVP